MVQEVIDFTHNFLSLFDKVRIRYELNIGIIKQCDEETQDLLHEIELSEKKNASAGYHVYNELRNVRKRRREAKDENSILEEMYNFLTQNQQFKNRLSTVNGKCSRTMTDQRNRVYRPKQRNDLTITTEVCEKSLPDFEELMKGFVHTSIDRKKHKHL